MTLRRASNYVLANLGLWALTYAITTARVLSSTMPHPADMAMRRALVCVAGFLTCLAMAPILRRVAETKIGARIAWAIGLSAAGGFIYALVNYTAFYVVAPRWEHVPLSFMSIAEMASLFFWTFLAWCVLYLAIRYEDELKDKTLRLVSAQALAMDAQNRMLRYQINPHFLFNTLNALSSLILAKETARADRMVLSLSSFLRYTLEKELPEKAPLSDEIATQLQYLSIEQARFEERLVFRDQVPDELRNVLVPSLILQPLIENAVKYGVARSAKPVTVELFAEAAAGRLQLTVADDGRDEPGTDPPKLGLGLENVRLRLEAIYGREAVLRFWRRKPHGFAAAIEIPLERA